MSVMGNFSAFAHAAYALIQGPLALGEDNFLTSSWRKLTRRKPLQLSARAVAAYRSVIAVKVGRIERLPSKYRKEAIEAVWNAVMRGYDDPGLAQELHDQFGFARDRARTIAKDQCRMARAVIENAENMEKGFLNAAWVYKPRCTIASHSAIHGRRYNLRTGAEIDDKHVLPGGEPGCFCSGSVGASEA
jgi:hypothetical protein